MVPVKVILVPVVTLVELAASPPVGGVGVGVCVLVGTSVFIGVGVFVNTGVEVGVPDAASVGIGVTVPVGVGVSGVEARKSSGLPV
jgi:hypothetical protein